MDKYIWCVREGLDTTKFETIEEAHAYLRKHGYRYVEMQAAWFNKDNVIAWIDHAKIKKGDK